ncbi:hypothetical protein GCM10011359_02580 [Nesterenkonia alkaliphila]|nr:hypothetical protein GCM10011359_02580 [Nesterenkonia alkaliphila]
MTKSVPVQSPVLHAMQLPPGIGLGQGLQKQRVGSVEVHVRHVLFYVEQSCGSDTEKLSLHMAVQVKASVVVHNQRVSGTEATLR